MSLSSCSPAWRKTVLCKYHTRGNCESGEACSFAHGPADLQDRPDLTGTKRCLDFARRGLCSWGSKCKFAHYLPEAAFESNRSKSPLGSALQPTLDQDAALKKLE